jgi:prepilin-type N-terminal cleavage/methylation domain-containing protein
MLGHWPSIDLYRTQSTSVREAILNPHHPTRQQPKGQTGFSFIETLIVLAVLSVVVVQQLRTSELTSVDRVATGMVEKFQRVQRASMRFYIKEEGWPANVQALKTKGFLNDQELSNTWGKPFELTVDEQDLLISSDLTEVRYASRVAGRLPRASLSVPDAAIAVSEASGVSRVGEVSNAGTVANALTTKVTSRIDPPGHEAAHNKLYRLDGSKPLEGPMNLNGYNVSNGGDIISEKNITAQKFIDFDNKDFYLDPNDTSNLNSVELQSLALMPDVVVGDDCDVKTIGTTRLGKFVSCEKMSDDASSTWRASHELPVGSIYIAVTEESPAVSLGYGTWKPFGEGQVLVGSISADAPDKCAPGGDVLPTSVSADCLFYELEATHDGSTGAAALSLRQMPDHRHWAKVVPLEKEECYEFWENDEHCVILSEQASLITATTRTRNSAQQRARSTNKLLTPIEMAIKEYHAQLAAAKTEAEKLSIMINFLNNVTDFVDDIHRKPFRNRALDDEFSEGHQHEINQPSIVVKMWKRTL